MFDLAFAMKLGAWAFTSLAAGLNASGYEFASLLAEVGDRSIEAGHAVWERPRDVVAKASGRVAKRIEREHRDYLDRAFSGRPQARAEAAGTIAALADVLKTSLPDPTTVARDSLNATAIADLVVRDAGKTDERFRPGTFGARLLRQLVADVFNAVEHDAEFRAEMQHAIIRVLEERSRAAAKADAELAKGQRRIEALLEAGAARLHLLPRHRLRAAPRDLRELLMTELRATDLVGRQDVLQPLKTWLGVQREGRDISVHCLTGQAGAGKTRLAIELCEWAEQAGWSAGFARQEELERFHKLHHPTDWRWPKPTLVVVDYAAASAPVLRAWLDELASRCAGREGAAPAGAAAGTLRQPRRRLVGGFAAPGTPVRPWSRTR